MIKNITRFQKRVLDYYDEVYRSGGVPPTYKAAAEHLGMTPSAVHFHVKNLAKMGYLDGNLAPTLGSGSASVPLLGEVACGKPIQVFEDHNEAISVGEDLTRGGGAFYALRARGDSMKNAGIKSGDVLLIRKQGTVNDGDIAVVVISDPTVGEVATLKRVYFERKSVILRAENDDIPAMVLGECEIRGKLTSVIRKY